MNMFDYFMKVDSSSSELQQCLALRSITRPHIETQLYSGIQTCGVILHVLDFGGVSGEKPCNCHTERDSRDQIADLAANSVQPHFSLCYYNYCLLLSV